MTITRTEKFSLPQQSTALITSAENTSDVFFCLSAWVRKVLAAEPKLRPSLTRERKKLNSQKNGSTIFLPGTIFFAKFVSSVHTKNSTNSSYDGTNGWDINRMKISLKRNSIHPVFAEKSYPKRFEMCTNMGRLSCPRHETPWNRQHVIHHVVGFIQIPRTQWVGIYTLCYRIMYCPCFSYEPKQMFISCLSRIYFVIKDTTLMKAW